jgi:hypothetical protein
VSSGRYGAITAWTASTSADRPADTVPEELSGELRPRALRDLGHAAGAAVFAGAAEFAGVTWGLPVR